MENNNINDSYEKGQRRLRNLFEDMSSDEYKVDPFYDSSGEYGSDRDYVPTNSSSITKLDQSEISDSEAGTSSTLRKFKSENMRQGTSVQDTASVQSNDLQNAEECVSEQEEDLVKDITQQALEIIQQDTSVHGTNLDDSEWEEDTTSDIPDFHFDQSTNCLKIDLNRNSTHREVVKYIFTENILQHIVDCSNDYGQALTEKDRPKTKNYRNAQLCRITPDEMKKFFALCMLQEQISTTNVGRFFSYADVLYFHPIFSYVMSGRIFESILRV